MTGESEQARPFTQFTLSECNVHVAEIVYAQWAVTMNSICRTTIVTVLLTIVLVLNAQL